MFRLLLNALAVAVDGLCTIAGHVGRELAPHVKKHGAKLIPESMKKDKEGRSNIDGAMVVAASGVQGNVKYIGLFCFTYTQGTYYFAKTLCLHVK